MKSPANSVIKVSYTYNLYKTTSQHLHFTFTLSLQDYTTTSHHLGWHLSTNLGAYFVLTRGRHQIAKRTAPAPWSRQQTALTTPSSLVSWLTAHLAPVCSRWLLQRLLRLPHHGPERGDLQHPVPHRQHSHLSQRLQDHVTPRPHYPAVQCYNLPGEFWRRGRCSGCRATVRAHT